MLIKSGPANYTNILGTGARGLNERFVVTPLMVTLLAVSGAVNCMASSSPPRSPGLLCLLQRSVTASVYCLRQLNHQWHAQVAAGEMPSVPINQVEMISLLAKNGADLDMGEPKMGDIIKPLPYNQELLSIRCQECFL